MIPIILVVALLFGLCGKWAYDRGRPGKEVYRQNLELRCKRMAVAPMKSWEKTMCKEFL